MSESLISFKSTSDIGRVVRAVVMIANRIGLATVAAAAVLAVPETPADGGAGPGAGPAAGGANRSTTAAARPDIPVAAPESTEGRIRYPAVGSRRWRVAVGTGDYIGDTGRLLRFRVLVERDISNLDAGAVADFVEATLADPRGWTAGGTWRFRRVGPGEPHHFTIYVAAPATRDALCQMGYDRYTSCRNSNRVVLNVARWKHGVPHFRSRLDTYRQYVINHEVGHLLGRGHERCPARGRPAPVMQQQTLGLHGCRAYAWPYLNGPR